MDVSQIRCSHCNSRNLEETSNAAYFKCSICGGLTKVKKSFGRVVAEKAATKIITSTVLGVVGFVLFGPAGGAAGLGLSSLIASSIDGDTDPSDFV